MQTSLPISKRTSRCIARATKWMAISICLVVCAAFAQTIPERFSQTPAPKASSPAINTMAEAIVLVQQHPKKYQIYIQDLIKGDTYSDIQSVVVDKTTGWIQIHFNYRGRTSVSLTPVAVGSFDGIGSYPISIPILGTSEVKVNLTFSPDGSARGEWKNMGYEGAFGIVRK